MEKILYTQDGKEYYKNPDGRLVNRIADQSKGYRESELDPGVIEILEEARERGRYPQRSTIDSLIQLQKESANKAIKYAGYRLLGRYSYQEVFGNEAEREYLDERRWAIVDEMRDQMEQMNNQMQDMHRLILNMAKYMNAEKKSFYQQKYK